MAQQTPLERLPEHGPEGDKPAGRLHAARKMFRAALFSTASLLRPNHQAETETRDTGADALEYHYAMTAKNVLDNLDRFLSRSSLTDSVKAYVRLQMKPLQDRAAALEAAPVKDASEAARLETDVNAFVRSLSPNTEFTTLGVDEAMAALQQWALKHEASADRLLPRNAARKQKGHLSVDDCNAALEDIDRAYKPDLVSHIRQSLSVSGSLLPMPSEAEQALNDMLAAEREYWVSERKRAEAVERR